MAKLVWDATGQRFYETGTSQGVLFVQGANGVYGNGVAWNGLIGVTMSPSGAEETALYANDDKYGSLRSREIGEGSISAYTYPDEWMACDGSATIAPGIHVGQQTRRTFAMAWRTIVGNDTEAEDYGYKLHIIYGATASPSEKEYASVNDSPEAIEFSWDFVCTPVKIEGLKPTAELTIESNKVDPTVLKLIEDSLYGTDATEATLLMPQDIIDMIASSSSSSSSSEGE